MANNYRTKSRNSNSFKRIIFSLFVVIMISVTLYVANYIIKRQQSLSAGAASGNAEVFIEPTLATLPPDTVTNLWVTTDKQIGFFATELDFDPTLVKLTQELTITSPLTRIIRQSTMAEANKSGKIFLIVAIEPTNLAAAPTGNIKLASVKFGTLSTASNQTVKLSFNPATTQLVDSAGTPFNTTFKPASLTLNPVAITSPIATAVPTPVPATPAPTTIPTTSTVGSPSITINSPKEGSVIPRRGVWIGTTSTDADGISQTNFYFDGTLIKTCGAQSVCDYTYRSAVNAGSHIITVEVMDNSSLHAKSTRTINVVK